MATTYKVLGQAQSAGTIYTVPVGASAVISTISICNSSPSIFWFKPAKFRVAVVKAGLGSPDSKSWIVYDALINPSDTVALTIGITMSAGDYIWIESDPVYLQCTIFGAQIS